MGTRIPGTECGKTAEASGATALHLQRPDLPSLRDNKIHFPVPFTPTGHLPDRFRKMVEQVGTNGILNHPTPPGAITTRFSNSVLFDTFPPL